MKLIVGLGNPGTKYENTFHNLGFAVINNLIPSIQPTLTQKKFKSQFYKGSYQNSNYALLLPQTYINLSGDALISCVNFYKIQLADILVVSDSLDLPIGKLRYKLQGSAGGHNGLKDIILKLGSDKFARLNLGIGKPENKSETVSYVLKKIPPALQKELIKVIDKATEICCQFILGLTTANFSEKLI